MTDETTLPDIDSRHNRLVRWGLIGTAAYLVPIAIYFACQFHVILTLLPNEFGDLMAGIFAPLALGWLVLGFFQQGQELQASTTALQLQADELKNSVLQQQELVSVTRQQLEDERLRADAADRAAHNAAQPRFVVRGNSSSSMPDHDSSSRLYTFNISNAGSQCRDARITWDEARPPRRISVWKSGQDFNFTFPFKEVQQDRIVEIQFADERGNVGQKQLLLVNTGGALVLIDPD